MNTTRKVNPPRSLKRLAFILALIQIGTGAGQGAAYDLSADFSLVSNPSGPWSYGAMTNLGGTFTLMTVRDSGLTDNGVRVDSWELVLGTQPGIQLNNTTNTAISDGGQGVYPPGTVTIFSGGNGPVAFGVARFTVPAGAAGSYLLQTTAHTYLNGPSSGDTELHILKNGIELFGRFIPANSGTNYTTNLSLAVGDTVDFAVGRGLDGNGNFSALQIKASLTSAFCTPHRATATASNINGFVVGANILDPGCGYTNAPLVFIQGGGGSNATAFSTISDGHVSAIFITNAGMGYTNAPKILIASPPFVPTVGIRFSRVEVSQHVTMGLNYVLESSFDLINWTPTGAPFTATDENITTEFVIDQTGQYFRLRQVP